MISAKFDETIFKEKVLLDLKKLDGFVIKTQERTVKGIPDLIGCFNGRFVAIELKTDKGEVTPIQEYRLKQILKAGGLAFSTSPSTWKMHLEVLTNSLART